MDYHQKYLKYKNKFQIISGVQSMSAKKKPYLSRH